MKNLKHNLICSTFKKLSLSAALGFVVLSTQTLQAAEMPCVKELCIGDGLDKLHGINFQPVNIERVNKLSARKKADRSHMYGHQGKDPSTYILLGKFDKNALSDMANIKTACTPNNGLEGVYESESGHKTTVQVAMWPDQSGNMRWLVKSISRAYKGIESRSESDELIQSLNEKYAKWHIGKVGQPKPGNAGMLLVPVREPAISLFLAPTAEVIQSTNYKTNPLCKPTKTTNLD